MKRIFILAIVVFVFLIFYSAICFHVSSQLQEIIEHSNATIGQKNIYPEIISDEDFIRLCGRHIDAIDIVSAGGMEQTTISKLYVRHNFKTGKAWYHYSYAIYDAEGVRITEGVHALVEIYFTLSTKGVKINKVYEKP